MADIEQKIEQSKAVEVVEPTNKQIAPTEPPRQYAQMTAPMSQFVSQSTIKSGDTVSDEVTQKIQGSVDDALKNEKYVKRKSRKLAKVGDRLVEEEIKGRDNIASAKRAQNKVDRQIIKNNTYIAKQEKKRAVKEQRHLNKCQRETHKQEIASYRWREYGEMLKKYGYDKTPATWVFRSIVFFDGAARFLDALNKANNKLFKALKFVIIAGVLVGAYALIKKYIP